MSNITTQIDGDKINKKILTLDLSRKKYSDDYDLITDIIRGVYNFVDSCKDDGFFVSEFYISIPDNLEEKMNINGKIISKKLIDINNIDSINLRKVFFYTTNRVSVYEKFGRHIGLRDVVVLDRINEDEKLLISKCLEDKKDFFGYSFYKDLENTNKKNIPYPIDVINDLLAERTFSKDCVAHHIPSDKELDLNDIPNTFFSSKQAKEILKDNIVMFLVSSDVEMFKMHKRIVLVSNGLKNLCALTKNECDIISKAIKYASRFEISIDWVAISSGAAIEYDSGTENLDATADVLKDIILFTQNGGEINVIVPSINVGAQSYWNAEATMLMHTKGILIMTEEGSMILTGKKALDFSGATSAENNVKIGGAIDIMRPNGQSQFLVKNLNEAIDTLMLYYDFTVKTKKETLHKTTDFHKISYVDKHNSGFSTLGDIFSLEKNKDKKKQFDMRQIILGIKDTDSPFLERWEKMEGAQGAITGLTRIEGQSFAVVGVQSHQNERSGLVPNTASVNYSAGTLYPKTSKKIARMINASSGKVPLLILANLSGFDGSPDSLKELQLEYGAEIGRAIVNFKGKIIFIVLSRYHGGAYVVFSKKLNKNIVSLAIEGTFASVIGGAPAAAVVFSSQIDKKLLTVETYKKIKDSLDAGVISKKEYEKEKNNIRLQLQSEFAEEFEKVHSVERALKMGSIDKIIKIENIKEEIFEALNSKS